MKKLTKKELCQKYFKFDKLNICKSKTKFIDFLNQIENELYTHSFKYDYRYVCLGRQRFIINEMKELYYTKEQCECYNFDLCPTVFCLNSLIELMCNPNFLGIEDYRELKNYNKLYQNKNPNECRKIYDTYISNGIISLQERDFIMHALNMIKDSLSKCNDRMKWQ